MGCKEKWFHKVVENIRSAVKIKKENKLKVTIGMQMVFMPQYHDQILPLAEQYLTFCQTFFHFFRQVKGL